MTTIKRRPGQVSQVKKEQPETRTSLPDKQAISVLLREHSNRERGLRARKVTREVFRQERVIRDPATRNSRIRATSRIRLTRQRVQLRVRKTSRVSRTILRHAPISPERKTIRTVSVRTIRHVKEPKSSKTRTTSLYCNGKSIKSTGIATGSGAFFFSVMKTRPLTGILTAVMLMLFTQCSNDKTDEHPAEQSMDSTGTEVDGTYQEEYEETDSAFYNDSI
jgi:hypothetical protein